MRKLIAISCFLFCFMLNTIHSQAANPRDVVINEIAWMGTDANTSDEWIEFYNATDAAINISTWSIYGADTGVCLNFSAADDSTTTTIAAHGYLIYANHDDDVNDPAGTSIVDIWDATIGLNDDSPGQLILYDAPNCGGNEIDRANQTTDDWFAGEATARKTMERVYSSVSGTVASNWVTNDGVIQNGFDAANNSIHGTPKAQNSPLIVTSHTPDKNELNIEKDANIEVQFSQNISATTVTESTFNVDGCYTGVITDSYTVNGNTVTFNPTTDFEPGEVVIVTLTTDIQSTNGASLANPYTYQFTVKSAQSCGVFAEQSVISTTADPRSVYAADIDGDGDLDVLSTSEDMSSGSGDEDHIAWYENDNSWHETVISNSVMRPICVYAADIDGDGDMDVLSASRGDNKIAWYENTDGNGTFGSQQVISTNADIAQSVYAADIDGDGDLDVLSASRDDYKIAWYENGNSWNETAISTNAGSPYSVYAADIDNDGDMDVLSGFSSDKIAWYENGNSWNETVISTSADFVEQIYAADLDGDGDMDVISASYRDNKIAWFENGNSWNETVISDKVGSGAWSVYAVDMDGDGDMDVLSCSRNDDVIYWFENGNSWNETVVSTAANGPVSVFAADVDDDGDMDVLSASIDDKIAWYANCLDFGDLPANYSLTTSSDDGARHNIGDIYLGTEIDSETDGQESADAGRAATDGDDGNPAVGGDDEDGVTVNGDWQDGTNGGAVDVTVSGGSGYLSGWIDWDNNSNFTDGGDQVLDMKQVVAGAQLIQFYIPDGAIPSDGTYNRFARFRLVPDDGTALTLTGLFNNGEVEDYYLQFTGMVPDLSITKSVNPTTAMPGEAITYTITFSNIGTGVASGVVITDIVPVSVTVTSVISSSVAITQTNVGVVTYTWEVQDLVANQGGVITITGQLSATLATGTFTNTAVITTTAGGDAADNNSSEAGVTVDDGDGVPAAVEDGAPNGGDGNNDGAPDSQQGNVASLPNAVDGRYVTLVSPPGTDLAGVQAVDTPADAPAGVAFPVGLFQFTVQGLAPGGATAVTLLLPAGLIVDTYYKHGPNPPGAAVQWYEFLFDAGSGTGANIGAGQVVLNFVDGQRGDDLAGLDGQIVDQGGPGQPPPVPVGGIVVPVNKLGLVAPWMGVVALVAIGGMLLLWARRRT